MLRVIDTHGAQYADVKWFYGMEWSRIPLHYLQPVADRLSSLFCTIPRKAYLYSYTQTKQSIDYPLIHDQCDRVEDSHFYWAINVKIKIYGKWISKNFSVPLSKLNEVRVAVANQIPATQIIQAILQKKITL
ncbi:MAG: hypothetical protein F6K44_00955 [Moorea sp. SIO3E2]|nr:hypothetical protein [Moorena sp. SIO3E2]